MPFQRVFATASALLNAHCGVVAPAEVPVKITTKNTPKKLVKKWSRSQRYLPLFAATFGLALGTYGAFPAFAQTSVSDSDGNIHLGSVSDQSIGLGAKLELTVNVTADQAQTVNLAIDSEDLAEQIQDSDISIQVNPPQLSLADGETKEVKLEIQTKTSAPSFNAKKFGLLVKSDKGSLLTSTDINLKVLPLYVVTIIDGVDSDNPYDFDSQPGTSYFRAHEAGLQFVFKNLSKKHLSAKPVIIHGSGVIKHQDVNFTPGAVNGIQYGDVYQPEPAVLPAAGDNLPGYYTIHDIYHPDRSVIVNATKIPASN
jgi:hypothetical protein